MSTTAGPLGISWYASLIPAGLTYLVLMKTLPSAARFRH